MDNYEERIKHYIYIYINEMIICVAAKYVKNTILEWTENGKRLWYI